MTTESVSIQAIRLARSVFESVYGNVGLLKFNIEKLTPMNGSEKEESKKWEIVCSFYETLGSTAPSQYQVFVDLNKNAVEIKKLSKSADSFHDKAEGTYKFVKTVDQKK